MDLNNQDYVGELSHRNHNCTENIDCLTPKEPVLKELVFSEGKIQKKIEHLFMTPKELAKTYTYINKLRIED